MHLGRARLATAILTAGLLACAGACGDDASSLPGDVRMETEAEGNSEDGGQSEDAPGLDQIAEDVPTGDADTAGEAGDAIGDAAEDGACLDRDGDGLGDGCPDGPDCFDGSGACTTDCADRNADGRPDCLEPPATLDDYWNGRASWKFVRAWTLATTGWTYGYGAGAHLEIRGDTWYLFSRKVLWGTHFAG